MMNRLLAASLIVIALLIGRPLFASTDWSIDTLMAALASVAEVEAVFHERKELAVLEQPLELSGVLRYRAPNDLQKEVLSPEPVRYAIETDRVVIEQPDGRREEFSLDQYPLLRVLTESMRATLAGDLMTLQRLYRLQLSGDQPDWTLRLEPLDADVARRVTAVVIHGSDRTILSVETLESGGDRSIMTITSPAG
jgi:hypothetical protein